MVVFPVNPVWIEYKDLHSRSEPGVNSETTVFNHSASVRCDSHRCGSLQEQIGVRLPRLNLVSTENQGLIETAMQSCGLQAHLDPVQRCIRCNAGRQGHRVQQIVGTFDRQQLFAQHRDLTSSKSFRKISRKLKKFSPVPKRLKQIVAFLDAFF